MSVMSGETVKSVVQKVCASVPLEPRSHFMLLRKTRQPSECLIPNESEVLLPLLRHYGVELRERLVYHVDLGREGVEVPLGLTVRAVRMAGGDGAASVTSLDPEGQAARKGIAQGDALLAVNGAWVSGLGSADVERQLHAPGDRLCLVLRTARATLPPPLRPLPANYRQLSFCTAASPSSSSAADTPRSSAASSSVRFSESRTGRNDRVTIPSSRTVCSQIASFLPSSVSFSVSSFLSLPTNPSAPNTLAVATPQSANEHGASLSQIHALQDELDGSAEVI